MESADHTDEEEEADEKDHDSSDEANNGGESSGGPYSINYTHVCYYVIGYAWCMLSTFAYCLSLFV